MKNIISLYCSLALALVISCDTVYLDPYSELEPDVISNQDKLTELINGMQLRYSTDRAGAIYTTVTTTGLNVGELRLLNPGNLGENELLLGGNTVTGSNEVLQNMWSQLMLLRKEATLVIDNADIAASNTQAANTLKAYAYLYRALAHGSLIQYFEELPLSIENNDVFNSKDEVLADVVQDLSTAKDLISSGLDNQVSGSLTSTFDIQDVVSALLARYQLMSGNYSAALQEASQVSLINQNVWNFADAFPNPLAFWFSSNNVHQAKDLTFGLPQDLAPETDDMRVAFYIRDANEGGETPDYRVQGFYNSNTDDIPIYLPGEMLLIQAEATVRAGGDLDEAISYIDAVRTKTADDDVFGIGATLSPYSGERTTQAVLDEIYRNRRIELYLSAMALEDSRRFGRPDTERNRNYYPYPFVETDNNNVN